MGILKRRAETTSQSSEDQSATVHIPLIIFQAVSLISIFALVSVAVNRVSLGFGLLVR